MVCQKVKIKNPAGLHLRPAGKLCDEAIKYKSKISYQIGTMEKMKKKRWQELYQ